jgi:hypothetical protein
MVSTGLFNTMAPGAGDGVRISLDRDDAVLPRKEVSCRFTSCTEYTGPKVHFGDGTVGEKMIRDRATIWIKRERHTILFRLNPLPSLVLFSLEEIILIPPGVR